MNDTTTFLMEKGCPWVNLRESTGLPDILWCEKQLCSWIATPANTWSNLAYIAVGILFFWITRKDKSENIRFYGPAALWVGWGSFIYHASLFFGSQLLDFFGMYIFFYLILVQNAARIGWIASETVKRNVWILTGLTTVLSAIAAKFEIRLQPVVMVLVVFVIATEILATRRAKLKVQHKFMALSVLFLGIGAVFSGLDITRKFCDPENHWVQAHAIWHYFGAIALFFSIHHYRQFYSRETGKMVT